MIVVDKIKKAAPKWVPPPPKPTFKSTLDKERWWDKRKIIWREGYGDGYSRVCGMHAFYMLQGHLKDGSDGSIIQPRYRDCDDWMISKIHKGFWGLQNHDFIIKRREIGLTSIGAGLLPAYTMRMFPSSTFGATSCDQPRIFKAFNDKTEVFIKRLDEDIRPVFDRTVGYKENATKQQVYQRLPWLVKSKTGELDMEFSDLYAKETAESDSASTGFSSTRLRAAFIDELALHRRKKKLLGSMEACVMKGPVQSGYILAGGTVEESLTPDQISELQTIIRDSEIFKFDVTFAPAWWGLFEDESGVSDEKKGVAFIMAERERRDKSTDKSYLRTYIKNYPLSLEEVFNLGGGGRYDDETVDKINEQVRIVVKNRFPCIGHDIVVEGTTVRAEPNPKSNIIILEHPKPNIDYIFGYDGTMTSKLTSDNKEASMVALLGMKGIDPQAELQFAPIVKYSERPKSIEAANRQGIKVLKYYNQFGRMKCMGETNAGGESFIQMMQNNELASSIMFRKDLSQKGFVDTKNIWCYKNNVIGSWLEEACNIYYKKNAHMVRFLSLLQDAQKADSVNKDEEAALKMCLYGFGTGDLLGDIPKPKATKKITVIVGYDHTGRPILKEFSI